MPKVKDLLRKRVEADIRASRPTLHELARTEWSREFEQRMRNRLIMGALRYQTFKEKRTGHSFNLLGSIQTRLDLYARTGNQEHLVDCANLLMLEYECPTHKNPHWSPTDDGIHVNTQ